MTPAAMMAMVARMVGGADGQAARMMRGRLDNAYALVERRLGETPFLAGDDLTAADIIAVFGLTTMRRNVPVDLASFPNIRAYLARIGFARPTSAPWPRPSRAPRRCSPEGPQAPHTVRMWVCAVAGGGLEPADLRVITSPL